MAHRALMLPNNGRTFLGLIPFHTISTALRCSIITEPPPGFTRVRPSGLPFALGQSRVGLSLELHPSLHTSPLPATHGRIRDNFGQKVGLAALNMQPHIAAKSL